MLRRTQLMLSLVLLVPPCAWAEAQQGQSKPAGAGRGGKTTQTAPPEKTGIAVGQKAPEFALQDQAGKERQLGEWLNDGKLAVVFYRSASW